MRTQSYLGADRATQAAEAAGMQPFGVWRTQQIEEARRRDPGTQIVPQGGAFLMDYLSEAQTQYGGGAGGFGGAGGGGDLSNLTSLTRQLISQQTSDVREAQLRAEQGIARLNQAISNFGVGGKVEQYGDKIAELAAQIEPGMSDEEIRLAYNRILESEISPAYASERRRIAEQGGTGARQRLSQLRLQETGARVGARSRLQEQQLASRPAAREQAARLYGSAAQLLHGAHTDKVNALLTLEGMKDYSVPDYAGPMVQTLASISPEAAMEAVGSGSLGMGGIGGKRNLTPKPMGRSVRESPLQRGRYRRTAASMR